MSKLTKKQKKYLKYFKSDSLRTDAKLFFRDFNEWKTNFEPDITQEVIPVLFCTKITEDSYETLCEVHNKFHQGLGGNLEFGDYLLSNAAFTHCISSNNPGKFSNKKYTEVDTETFLRLIGKAPVDEFINKLRNLTEPKVKISIDTDERLKGTGYENSFFKSIVPVGTPFEDVLKARDEFFKKEEINRLVTQAEQSKFFNANFASVFTCKSYGGNVEPDKITIDTNLKYTQEDLHKAFVQSRMNKNDVFLVPHEVKYEVFEDYLKTINKK